MPEELTVAAVTVLALLLVGGGGGAGAVLRAAVLVGALVPVVLLRVIHTVLTAVPLTVRVTAKPHTGQLLAATPTLGVTQTRWCGQACELAGHTKSLHCPSRHHVVTSNRQIQR